MMSMSNLQEGYKPEAIAARFCEQARPRTEVSIDHKLFENYVGHYQFETNAVLTVTCEKNHLFAQLTGHPSVEIFPEGDQDFFLKVVAAQFTFVTDGHGNASEVVLHQNGFDYTAKRIDGAEASCVAAALAKRIHEKTPMPESEETLRHHIHALERGKPDYKLLSEQMAARTRDKLPLLTATQKSIGALQSLSFIGVGQDGWDVFDAKFKNGVVTYRVNLRGSGGGGIGSLTQSERVVINP